MLTTPQLKQSAPLVAPKPRRHPMIGLDPLDEEGERLPTPPPRPDGVGPEDDQAITPHAASAPTPGPVGGSGGETKRGPQVALPKAKSGKSRAELVQEIGKALEVNREDLAGPAIQELRELGGDEKSLAPYLKYRNLQYPLYKSGFGYAEPFSVIRAEQDRFMAESLNDKKRSKVPVPPSAPIPVHGSSVHVFNKYGEPGQPFTGLVRFRAKGSDGRPADPKIVLFPTQVTGTYKDAGLKEFPDEKDQPEILREAQVYGLRPGEYSTHTGMGANSSHAKLARSIEAAKKQKKKPLVAGDEEIDDLQDDGMSIGFTVIRGGAGSKNKYTFVSRSSNNRIFGHETVPSAWGAAIIASVDRITGDSKDADGVRAEHERRKALRRQGTSTPESAVPAAATASTASSTAATASTSASAPAPKKFQAPRPPPK